MPPNRLRLESSISLIVDNKPDIYLLMQRPLAYGFPVIGNDDGVMASSALRTHFDGDSVQPVSPVASDHQGCALRRADSVSWLSPPWLHTLGAHLALEGLVRLMRSIVSPTRAGCHAEIPAWRVKTAAFGRAEPSINEAIDSRNAFDNNF